MSNESANRQWPLLETIVNARGVQIKLASDTSSLAVQIPQEMFLKLMAIWQDVLTGKSTETNLPHAWQPPGLFHRFYMGEWLHCMDSESEQPS